jgi:hypothetical protein
MYPSLDLVYDGATTSVSGMFPVMHDGVELDRFHIRIELRPEHPRYCPRVFEIGGRLAPTLEGHFMPDGSACLFHPLVYWTEHFHLRSFADFLCGPVHNFFLYQAAVAAEVPWTHGEVGHDLNSIAAFWAEAFGTTSEETARCAAAFQARPLTVRSPCPCGSGRATQLCHSRIARLLEHTPPHVIRVLVAPLAAATAGAA